MKYVKPMKQIRTYTLACLALLLASCNNDRGDFSDGTHTGNRNAVSVTFSLSSAVKSATGELMNNVVYPTATEGILVGEQHTRRCTSTSSRGKAKKAPAWRVRTWAGRTISATACLYTPTRVK